MKISNASVLWLAILMSFAGLDAARVAQAGAVPVSQDHAASERLFNSWKPPVEPRKIIGNIYYVGFAGVSSWLVTSSQGHVLIDTCFPESVPTICSNVEKLGFKVADIKYILNNHAHVDHAGGNAEMKRRTGARIVASLADAHLMETGGADDFSPFPKDLLSYPPVKADHIITDGDTISVGDVILMAHLTPGHTKGATTWTMPVKDGERTLQVVFLGSVGIAEPTKLLNNPLYPGIVEDYAETFRKLKELPCDVFLASHADQFGFTRKLARLARGETPNPFIDPQGWKTAIASSEATYQRQLDRERAGN